MKLIEIFDKPLPVKWDERYLPLNKIFANFEADGIQFEVMFTALRGEPEDDWMVGFQVQGPKLRQEPAELGSKGIQVFTTVVHIIDTFFDKKNLNSLWIKPMSQKLDNLYKKMAVYFSKKYDYNPGDDGGFVITKKVMEQDTLELPDINVGDEVKIGRWKNRKATVKGFKKDKKDNHPVLKTTKGDTKLFKPRISKIEGSNDKKT